MLERKIMVAALEPKLCEASTSLESDPMHIRSLSEFERVAEVV
jgi:hypothetical protein